MKTMKKLVAALLVLTMVLALTGSAFAACKFVKGDYVKFTKNAYAYRVADKSKTTTVVRHGSYGQVLRVCGSWTLVRLTPWIEDTSDDPFGNYEDPNDPDWWCWAAWFKTSLLTGPCPKHLYVDVTFSQGGVGLSLPVAGSVHCDTGCWFSTLKGWRISSDSKKHVKATKGSSWLHKTPSLSNNMGLAMSKGTTAKYLRKWGFDTRGVAFFKVKFRGKVGFVSEKYTKIVK